MSRDDERRASRRRLARSDPGGLGGLLGPPSQKFAREEAGGAVLEVLVQPRASRTRVVGEHDGRLKVQLAAPPVDGEANAALVAFLADALGVRKADVVIARGDTGRRKTVRIAGITAATAVSRLATQG